MSRKLSFDPLARPYKWLEYLTFGRSLENCRFNFLEDTKTARRALIFGDGDGRFTARMLAANSILQADVIDISPAMLRLLYEKLPPEAQARVTLHTADAREFIPPENDYDLVVSHFFLDCFTAAEISDLLDHITPNLQPGTRWIVSDFNIPAGKFASYAGRIIIRSLYAAFGLITGLAVRQLPDYEKVLKDQQLELVQSKDLLGGLLVSQMWQYMPHM